MKLNNIDEYWTINQETIGNIVGNCTCRREGAQKNT